MRFFSLCESCNKRAIILCKHKYRTKHAGIIVGQKETCNKCKKLVYQMLGEEVIQ